MSGEPPEQSEREWLEGLRSEDQDEHFKKLYQQQIVTKRCPSTYDDPTHPGHGTMCYQPEGHRGDHTNDAETPWSLRWRA